TEATTTPLEPRAITDRSLDPLIPHGAVLLDFVDAVLLGASSDQAAPRDQILEDLGEAALVDASGVIGNFQMMNRIADATGMPVGKATLKKTAEWRTMLNLDQFNHL
nr:hypothetical protein [Desulfuromonadales bacterium]